MTIGTPASGASGAMASDPLDRLELPGRQMARSTPQPEFANKNSATPARSAAAAWLKQVALPMELAQRVARLVRE